VSYGTRLDRVAAALPSRTWYRIDAPLYGDVVGGTLELIGTTPGAFYVRAGGVERGQPRDGDEIFSICTGVPPANEVNP
jgi:hypothetical protein